MTEQLIKYLGVDWGKKRIGLALGDSEIKTAVPFKVVGNLDEIKAIIEEEEINRIIIGLPKSMKGNNDLNNDFQNFIEEMKKNLNIPFEFVDERLSSKAADALAGDKKTKALRDAVAAMIILQSYLDRE